jgi:hypothetical protein
MPIKNRTQHPSQPIPKGADGSSVRFESNTLTRSEMPPLKLPAQITDRGIMRLGSCGITSER